MLSKIDESAWRNILVTNQSVRLLYVKFLWLREVPLDHVDSGGHVGIGEVAKLDFLGHGQSVISWSNQGTPKKYRKFLH